jgi:hypothetical protein
MNSSTRTPSAGSVMATSRAGRVRVHVRGRLDAAGAGRLRALLEDVAPGTSVRVDLSRAGTLPVAALQALAAAHARFADGDGLVVEHPSAPAERSLRTSGLHRVLRLERRPARPVVGPLQAAEA